MYVAIGLVYGSSYAMDPDHLTVQKQEHMMEENYQKTAVIIDEYKPNDVLSKAIMRLAFNRLLYLN
jgi:hypothetical protein